MTSGHRIARAGGWSIAGKLVGRMIDLVTLLTLARMLTPADVGLVAMAMTVLMIAEAITEMPVGQPILRIADPDRAVYNTAFTLSALRGVGLYLLIAGLSMPLAVFFGDARLASLLCLLGLAPVARGLCSPLMVEFLRRYDTRPEFWMDVASKSASLAVVVLVALLTGSYWAIAAGTVTTPIVLNAMSYAYAPYRPRWSLARWSEFADVIGWNSVSQVFSSINWQLDRILLGRLLPPSQLGRFTISSDLSSAPYQALVLPLTRPLLASFTQAGSGEALSSIWLKGSNAILFVVGPVLLGIAVLADVIVRVVLGSDWNGTEVILAGLAIGTLPTLPGAAINFLAVACRKTRTIATRLFIEFTIRVPITLIAILSAGVEGAIAARGGVSIAMAFVVMQMVRKLTGVSVVRQIASLLRTSISLAAFGATLYAFRPDIDVASLPMSAIMTAFSIVVALTAYLASAFILWRIVNKPAGVEAAVFSAVSHRIAALKASSYAGE